MFQGLAFTKSGGKQDKLADTYAIKKRERNNGHGALVGPCGVGPCVSHPFFMASVTNSKGRSEKPKSTNVSPGSRYRAIQKYKYIVIGNFNRKYHHLCRRIRKQTAVAGKKDNFK